MPVLYRDREEAGRRLLDRYDGATDDVVVLGIARGGIPVGGRLFTVIGGHTHRSKS